MERKITRGEVSVLELAKPRGNDSQACTIMGYDWDNLYRSADLVQRLPRDWGRPAPRGPL